jgi:hypothetical protein
LAVPVTAAASRTDEAEEKQIQCVSKEKQAEGIEAYSAAKKKAEAKSQPIAASKPRKAAVKKAAKKTASPS